MAKGAVNPVENEATYGQRSGQPRRKRGHLWPKERSTPSKTRPPRAKGAVNPVENEATYGQRSGQPRRKRGHLWPKERSTAKVSTLGPTFRAVNRRGE
jgi:hypothetical protein